MKPAHPTELSYGMEFYSTDFLGLGGRLKRYFEDFCVEEIDFNGQVLEIQPFANSWTETLITGEPSKYIKFIVQKKGLSTFDVVNILAASLRIPRHMVGYAGLKDKRAITTQHMTVPSRAADNLRFLRLSKIEVRNAHYVKTSLRIGDLWGNQFTIVLRDIERDSSMVYDALNSLAKQPILNYFGVQRFGVTRPQTHLVGKSMIKKDYETAIRIMIATPSSYESDELKAARKEFTETLTPTASLIELLPEDLRYEREVLAYLKNNPGDFKNALLRIPPKVQTLFVHSYQSYLFNRLISMRVHEGLSIDTPHVGDFLIQLDTTHSGRDSWLYVTSRNLEESTLLVQKDKYGIAAPVPGYATKLPPSKQTDLLLGILAEENISLKDFFNSENRHISTPGGLHLVSLRAYGLTVEDYKDALRFKFKLRKGSYATIVMREIMKNHPINRV